MSAARGRRVRWGQNFLVDANVAGKIVEWASPEGRDVLEIGPGRGALTEMLLERSASLTLLEIDPELAAGWMRRADSEPRLSVVEGDATDYDFALLPRPPKLVVSNLPYESGTAILMAMLESAWSVDEIVVMLQKEVCDRVTAAAGEPSYGMLAIHSFMRADVEAGMKVGPGAFRPQPKVDSRVLRLRPLAGLRYPVGDPAVFSWLVREAFARRRKMVRNSLGAAIDQRFGGGQSAGLLDRSEIAEDSRPEVVSPRKFARLSELVTAELVKSA